MTRIAIVAGEASGDLLGAALIQAVKERWPRWSSRHAGQDDAEGARSLFPMEKLAVRGYVEVIRSLREIVGIRNGIYREVVRERPALFIGIDAPDFNLGVEAKLKAVGIPTVHYVSPSLWAWRPERIHSIGKSVDRMLVMFPFEEEIYRNARIPVSYVGHPLADSMPIEPDQAGSARSFAWQREHRRGGSCPFALSELEFHADLMIETARALHAKRPAAFVPFRHARDARLLESRFYALEARSCRSRSLSAMLLALHACDVALVKAAPPRSRPPSAAPMVVTSQSKSSPTGW